MSLLARSAEIVPSGDLSQDSLTDPLFERKPGAELRAATGAGQISRIMDLVRDPDGGTAACGAGKGRAGTRAVTHRCVLLGVAAQRSKLWRSRTGSSNATGVLSGKIVPRK